MAAAAERGTDWPENPSRMSITPLWTRETGSCGGTRYRLAREPLKNVHYTPVDQRDPAVLLATVWPEPYAYGAADPETMTSSEFEFSAEGLAAAAKWLNGRITAEEE